MEDCHGLWWGGREPCAGRGRERGHREGGRERGHREGGREREREGEIKESSVCV